MNMTTDTTKLAYSVPEAAEAVSLSKGYLWDLVLKGEIRSVKIGKRRLIPADALQEFLAGARQ